MHRTKWSVAALAALAALGAAGCDADSLTRINENPNSPRVAPAGPVFTTAARLAATRWLGSAYSLRATELVAQHLAEVQYPESDQYSRLRANSTGTIFDQAYTQELKDLTSVIQAGLLNNEPGQYGPALALRSWVYGYITDTWGDVPYTSALAGDSTAAVISPTYDTQQAIYADLFATLDRVSRDLAAAPTSAASLGAADPIYAGNRLRWQRFANTVRARQAMRLANVDLGTARTQFQAAMAAAGGLLASNADNALVTWTGGVNANSNPWSVDFQQRDDHRISRTMLTLLRDTQDPRLAAWAQRAEADTTSPFITKDCRAGAPCYVGLQNALTQSQSSPLVAYTSRPSLRFYPASTTYGVSGGTGATTPSYLLTFAEASFLKAEAAERGFITGSARTFYEEGIRASMTQWGITDEAAITAHLARPGVAYAGGVEGQKQIARQRWLALFTDGGQAWAEWRRTCQPATIRPGPAAIINTVPRRFQYSVSEQQTNGANLSAAIAAMGGDEFTTRMYWDRSPGAAPTNELGASCGTR